MARVQCLRVFSFGGRTFAVGTKLDVPEATAKTHSKGNAPKLKILKDPKPKAEKKTPSKKKPGEKADQTDA